MMEEARSTGRRRWPVLIDAAVVAAVLGVLAWVFYPEPSGVADPNDPRQVAMGGRVYAEHCAACHGADLEGQQDWRIRRPDGRLPAPPHDETGHTWHHPDDHLFRITRDGMKPPLAPEGYESDMPAFHGKLSDDEIRAALAFIKSRWPPDIRARQESINERSSK